MALPGTAAVAMWWQLAPDKRAEFEDWHSHEHFPERMGIPGFLRGSRWEHVDNTHHFFVLYELEGYDVLTSPGYMERLNAPTPWSTKMMPHHQGMVRSQCTVELAHGGGMGTAVLAIRCAPAPGQGDALQARLAPVLATLPHQPGITATRLLVTRTPTTAAPTREQLIRGGDAVADWVVLVGGYDAQVLEALRQGALGDDALAAMGAAPGTTAGVHKLRYVFTPADRAALGDLDALA